MRRTSLSRFASIAATLTFTTLTASGQLNLAASSQYSASASAAMKRAALDLPAFSSSSSSTPDLFAAGAPSSSAAAAAPAAPASGGSSLPFSSVGIGVKVGLGGIGFDVATPLVPGVLNLRGGAGFFSYTYNGTISNEPVDATLKLDNAEVMVDVFPFKGSFRLSAGTTVYNTTGLNGTITVAPGSSLKIGNNNYISAPTPNQLTGNLSAGFGGKAVPRFSLGWGNMVPKQGHIKFETEFGVEIIGTPKVAWNYGGQACATSNGITCNGPYQAIASVPGASADIAAQTATLQNDVNSVKVFPIFSIGLSYKIGH